MSEAGTETLVCRIRQVVKIHAQAGDVTFAETIGVLEIIKTDILKEMQEDEDGYGD